MKHNTSCVRFEGSGKIKAVKSKKAFIENPENGGFNKTYI